jgi:enoyl-CoA hydratase/carnithine racemase
MTGIAVQLPPTKGTLMSSKSFDTIKYEVDGHAATITLNRPDSLNALSPHMIGELRAAYDEAENDEKVWLLIVTGTGRAFCTGADVKAIPGDGRVIYERPYLSTYEQWEAPQEGTPPFRRMAKPVLAAINGLCCGAGLDWVTTGDIVIASDNATFFDPHVSIGLVAGRELVRLARVLPRSVALRMALMGKHERMNAQRAFDLGMISEIVEHDHLMERAHEIADTINSNAPLAVRGTRLAILKGLDLPLHEAEMLAETFRERVLRTRDALEGPKAFIEKRAPDWQCR